jgi:hypothetical protein
MPRALPTPKPRWSVKVRKTGRTFRTEFDVEQQRFTLVTYEVPTGDPLSEGRQHCQFIGAMFLKALAKLGLTPEKEMGVRAPKRQVEGTCRSAKKAPRRRSPSR